MLGRIASRIQYPGTQDRCTDSGKSFSEIDILTQKRSPWLLLLFICIASLFSLLHQDSRVTIPLDPVKQVNSVTEIDQLGQVSSVVGTLHYNGEGPLHRNHRRFTVNVGVGEHGDCTGADDGGNCGGVGDRGDNKASKTKKHTETTPTAKGRQDQETKSTTRREICTETLATNLHRNPNTSNRIRSGEQACNYKRETRSGERDYNEVGDLHRRPSCTLHRNHSTRNWPKTINLVCTKEGYLQKKGEQGAQLEGEIRAQRRRLSNTSREGAQLEVKNRPKRRRSNNTSKEGASKTTAAQGRRKKPRRARQHPEERRQPQIYGAKVVQEPSERR